MSYDFLDDIATGDVAFKATGRTLDELFASAAEATLEVMVATATVEPKILRELELENMDIEALLYDFLENIIYLKDSEYLVFGKLGVKVQTDKPYKLKATLHGEKIDPSKHELRNDVKAVTYHMFEVKKDTEGWNAQVILDI
ncbi:MAG: archease [Candidatus Bathyarchaeia archaeon]